MILEMIALCILVASAGFVLGLKVGIRPGMDHLQAEIEAMRFKPVDANKVGEAILERGRVVLGDEEYELIDGKTH